ncbi:TetR family transcriptional regulator [Pseudonocardia acidicola]|uniref:TetR family transcriptional regulator n=1 Tax=Pseudonocardia acidicola TaxID=2724939 RepID=UPI001B7D0BCC
MSVPLGRHDGLPVGIHFAVRPGADRLLLALAYELEAAAPWVGVRRSRPTRPGWPGRLEWPRSSRRPSARIRDAALRCFAEQGYAGTSTAEIIRGHWGIENRLHWIRDVVLAEDHPQIRTGAGPAVMATLRNLAVSLHRLHGATNIARAWRDVARHPHRVLDPLT